jgi:NTE family protein
VKTRRRALVLQGGGALGAYAFGVIKALCEQPEFNLDVVTGVSIGAINAAVLVGAKNDPINALDELWRERLTIREWPFAPPSLARYSSLIANPAMYWLRPSYLSTPLFAPFVETSIYDITALRRTLADLIDFDGLNHNTTHLVMSAVDIETGEVMYFENQNEVPLSVDHIVASGGLAPSFPMTGIEDPQTGEHRWYWDGGFSSNLPMAKAINLLEQADPGNPDVQRELIVIELIPMRSELPVNLIEVQDRITQLLFSSKLTLDEKLFQHMNDYVDLIQQIDRELPPDSPIRQLPGYHDLKRHRKIDSFLVFTMTTSESHSGAVTFQKLQLNAELRLGIKMRLRNSKRIASRKSQQDQQKHLKANR